MLDTYKKLQANGVIGPLMKVGSDGKPIIDPSGEKPGQLVARPFAEYPKLLLRQRKDGTTFHVEVHSKGEELKVISENPDEELPRSPMERERDELATDLTTEREMNKKLAQQLDNAMSRIEQLMTRMDKVEAPKSAEAPTAPKGFPGQHAEAKAVDNRT
jgi:hypothetical protein